MDVSILSIASVTVTVILFGVLSYLGRKKNIDFGVLTILALIFGILIGIVFKNHVELTTVFGKIYANVISALVIPLLFVSIISSISSLENIRKLKTIGLKSIFWLIFFHFCFESPRNTQMDCGCSSVEDCLPGTCEVWGSMFSTEQTNKSLKH